MKILPTLADWRRICRPGALPMFTPWIENFEQGKDRLQNAFWIYQECITLLGQPLQLEQTKIALQTLYEGSCNFFRFVFNIQIPTNIPDATPANIQQLTAIMADPIAVIELKQVFNNDQITAADAVVKNTQFSAEQAKQAMAILAYKKAFDKEIQKLRTRLDIGCTDIPHTLPPYLTRVNEENIEEEYSLLLISLLANVITSELLQDPTTAKEKLLTKLKAITPKDFIEALAHDIAELYPENQRNSIIESISNLRAEKIISSIIEHVAKLDSVKIGKLLQRCFTARRNILQYFYKYNDEINKDPRKAFLKYTRRKYLKQRFKEMLAAKKRGILLHVKPFDKPDQKTGSKIEREIRPRAIHDYIQFFRRIRQNTSTFTLLPDKKETLTRDLVQSERPPASAPEILGLLERVEAQISELPSLRSLTYYSEAEQQQHRIFIHHGRFYSIAINAGGYLQFMPVSTQNHTSHLKNGWALLIVAVNGEIYITSEQPEPEGVIHSSLSRGGWVLYAGEIKITDGYITGITTHSGHYLPQLKHIHNILHYFYQCSVHLNQCWCYIRNNRISDTCEDLARLSSDDDNEVIKHTRLMKIFPRTLYTANCMHAFACLFPLLQGFPQKPAWELFSLITDPVRELKCRYLVFYFYQNKIAIVQAIKKGINPSLFNFNKTRNNYLTLIANNIANNSDDAVNIAYLYIVAECYNDAILRGILQDIVMAFPGLIVNNSNSNGISEKSKPETYKEELMKLGFLRTTANLLRIAQIFFSTKVGLTLANQHAILLDILTGRVNIDMIELVDSNNQLDKATLVRVLSFSLQAPIIKLLNQLQPTTQTNGAVSCSANQPIDQHKQFFNDFSRNYLRFALIYFNNSLIPWNNLFIHSSRNLVIRMLRDNNIIEKLMIMLLPRINADMHVHLTANNIIIDIQDGNTKDCLQLAVLLVNDNKVLCRAVLTFKAENNKLNGKLVELVLENTLQTLQAELAEGENLLHALESAL